MDSQFCENDVVRRNYVNVIPHNFKYLCFNHWNANVLRWHLPRGSTDEFGNVTPHVSTICNIPRKWW